MDGVPRKIEADGRKRHLAQIQARAAATSVIDDIGLFEIAALVETEKSDGPPRESKQR